MLTGRGGAGARAGRGWSSTVRAFARRIRASSERRSDPPALLDGQELVWTLGELGGKAERKVLVTVKPLRLGVLTEISDSSVAAIAAAGSVVADSRLSATFFAMSSGRPGSKIGMMPRVSA